MLRFQSIFPLSSEFLIMIISFPLLLSAKSENNKKSLNKLFNKFCMILEVKRSAPGHIMWWKVMNYNQRQAFFLLFIYFSFQGFNVKLKGLLNTSNVNL
mgnify:CR=1 FL=1